MKPELQKRLFTAGVLITLMLGLLFYAKASCNGHWLLIFAVALLNTACAYEFSRICTRLTNNFAKSVTYFLIALLPTIYTLSTVSRSSLCNADMYELKNYAAGIIHFSVLIVFIAFTYVLLSGKDSLDKANQVAGELISGTLLIAVGVSALYSISMHPASHYLVAWLIWVVAINDSAAYFTGSNIKSVNIVPAISPKKSLYGFLAGIFAGTLTGVVFGFLLSLSGFDYNLPLLALMSVSCVIAAQFGDLLKSYIKRLYGAKDSGTVLPGHGGVLDRVDGILAGAIVLSFFIFNLK